MQSEMFRSCFKTASKVVFSLLANMRILYQIYCQKSSELSADYTDAVPRIVEGSIKISHRRSPELAEALSAAERESRRVSRRIAQIYQVRCWMLDARNLSPESI